MREAGMEIIKYYGCVESRIRSQAVMGASKHRYTYIERGDSWDSLHVD